MIQINLISTFTKSLFLDKKLKLTNYCSGKNAFVKLIHLNKAAK